MEPADLEVQLKVWKDLVVSKQILIGAATEALGLDPDCSDLELKEALASATKRAIEADGVVADTKEQARLAISVMEKKMADAEQARDEYETAKNEALEARETAEKSMVAAREANIRELKKTNALLAAKEKALKVINVALADTPENVVKKLKNLKKEKLDEANERKRAEADASKQRKKKQELEKRVEEIETVLAKGAELAAKYREIHEQCLAQNEKLESLVADKSDLTSVSDLDESLLEIVEGAVEKESK